jgi:hypothetical protein
MDASLVSRLDWDYLLSPTLLAGTLLFALLPESPFDPALGLLAALSLVLLELLSELPSLDGALPFPLPLLAFFSLLAEAESGPPEPPSEFPDPFDPLEDPKEPGAVWLWA